MLRVLRGEIQKFAAELDRIGTEWSELTWDDDQTEMRNPDPVYKGVVSVATEFRHRYEARVQWLTNELADHGWHDPTLTQMLHDEELRSIDSIDEVFWLSRHLEHLASQLPEPEAEL